MKKNYILTLILTLLISGFSFGQGPMITIISDGDCSGGNPKMVEIYAQGAVDFTLYSLEKQSNGAASWGTTTSLQSFGTVTDDFIYIYSDSTSDEVFATEYPSASPAVESGVVNINGDDGIRIILDSDGSVVDQYGVDAEDGTGKPWEYTDGYAKRIDGTDPDGGFTASDWTYEKSGLDENGSCQGGTIFEDVMGGVGTYTPAATSTTVVLQDFTNLTNTATADVYGGFGGGLTATNALVDGPVDASNKVRTVTTTAGGDTWKGVFFRPQTHYIDLTSTKTVSVKVYSTTATYLKGIIQAGQSGQATIELETSEAHTGSGWETLTFTFPTATGEWGELALRTNVDANGALIDPAVEVLEAHFDDLTADQGSEIPAPASGPTDSPTAPTADAADVVSVFSDAYTNIATNYNPGWGQSGSVSTSFDPGDGNNVMLYSNFNFQGTDLTSTDLTAMEKLHIDIWVADASVRTIKVSPIGGGETLVTVPVTSGAWNSVDIPLSSFTAVNFAAVGQLKFDGQFAADGTTADTAVRSDVYLDNIYFYKESTAGVNDNNIINVSVYPNPSDSDWNFRTPNTVINSVEVFNLLGKRVASQRSNNNTEVSISTQGLTSGIYIARITTEQGTKSVKLIKN